MTGKETDFLCTRPALAARLIQDGYEPIETVNPWHTDNTAWLFNLDHVGVQIVAGYYCQIGKQMPSKIAQAITAAAASAGVLE
jgi:hypothetical protein